VSSIPQTKWLTPTVNHDKIVPYVDFPVVHNATVTTEPFYVDYDFTICSSDPTNTTLYKWNGVGWTEIGGVANPEKITIRGFFAVTTAANAYVTITEHIYPGAA
jgi:hypothetical protein